MIGVVGSIVVVASLAIGCGAASDTRGDATSSAPMRAPDRADTTSEQAGAGASSAAGGAETAAATDVHALEGASAAIDPAAVGRSVVSTATMQVEADNVVEAKQQATTIIESAGGAVFDEETELGPAARSTLTLRVPPDRFRTVVDALAGIGTLTKQGISTEDVTAQVVDLDARIATAIVSVDRLRGFLDKATSVNEIAQLENELLTREAGLESLRGQKRTLAGRVDLATIVLTVAPIKAVVPVVDETEARPGFLGGLREGWDTFLGIGDVAVAGVGWSLPFLAVLVPAGLVLRWYGRRRSGRASGQFPAPPSAGPSAPVGAAV